jgi:hypothetical protein
MPVPRSARWVRSLSLLLALLSITACGSAARRSAGTTVMALGAGAGLASVSMMVGSCADRDVRAQNAVISEGCRDRDPLAPNPTGGALVLTAGLTTIVAGGILFASGIRHPRAARPVSKP